MPAVALTPELYHAALKLWGVDPRLAGTITELVVCLARCIPPVKLVSLLEAWSRRLEDLKASGEGTQLEIHQRVTRGAHGEFRWDPDQRIG